MLDGFEPLVIVSGTPSITVTRNGVSFNKSVVEKLEMAKFVQFFIDRPGQRFAMVGCEENEPNSHRFYRGRKVSEGVRMNNIDLRETLSGLAGASSDEGFKVRGAYDPDSHGIIFDMSAVERVRSSRK